VRWTADQMIRRMLPEGSQSLWRDATGTVRLAEVHVDASWIGQRVSRLEEESGARVAFLIRYGEGLLPDEETVIQDGDLVNVMMRTADQARIEAVLERGPVGED